MTKPQVACQDAVAAPVLGSRSESNLTKTKDESVTQFFMLYNFLNDKLIYYDFNSPYTLTDEVALVLKMEIKPTSTIRTNKSTAADLEVFYKT